MINSFKVGDKVKILPKDDSTKYYPSYVNGMQKYTGQLATVTIVTSNNCRIDLDKGYWSWPFDALELITSETDETVNPCNIKNGDYIKITNILCEDTFIYLFREIKNNIIYRHASYFLNNNTLNVNPYNRWSNSRNTKITYATKEERKLLDKALLEQGLVWNDLTKQLDSIGLINVSLVNTYPTGISAQPVDVSSFRNSIQRANDVANVLSYTQEEPQTETKLNLFPTKKHYQLNFNY